MKTFYCAQHICGGTAPEGCSQCHTQNNKFIIDAVKGEPNSLTSIAYHTGEIIERERIIKLLEDERFAKAFGRSKDFNAKRANFIALIKDTDDE